MPEFLAAFCGQKCVAAHEEGRQRLRVFSAGLPEESVEIGTGQHHCRKRAAFESPCDVGRSTLQTTDVAARELGWVISDVTVYFDEGGISLVSILDYRTPCLLLQLQVIGRMECEFLGLDMTRAND